MRKMAIKEVALSGQFGRNSWMTIMPSTPLSAMSYCYYHHIIFIDKEAEPEWLMPGHTWSFSLESFLGRSKDRQDTSRNHFNTGSYGVSTVLEIPKYVTLT